MALVLFAYRTLSGLSNFAGAESNTDVAAGVLNFDSDGLGHEMAEACLDNLRKEFRGNDWGNNGPGVITRVLKKFCRTKHVSKLSCFLGCIYNSSTFLLPHLNIRNTKMEAQTLLHR